MPKENRKQIILQSLASLLEERNLSKVTTALLAEKSSITEALLDIMNETGSSLDDLLDSLPVSYSTPELNIDVPEERKFKIIEDFIENASIDGKKDFTDGLRASFENGWALLRASNTTPKLVLRFEANSQESLEKIQKNFLEELKKFLPNENINLE